MKLVPSTPLAVLRVAALLRAGGHEVTITGSPVPTAVTVVVTTRLQRLDALHLARSTDPACVVT